ncbi:MAG: YdbL family protein [Rubrivivax sp.]|nr:YdbL family protein [Rubrivivax sp.]
MDWIRLVRFGPAEAQAAMDINVSTPAIRSLQASMASRFPQLQPFYAKNAIGETNNGLLALQDTAALSLKERAEVTRLVEQENRDRQALYAEILRANNLDMGRLGEVQRLFANSWRGKSSPGWLIQLDSGQWVKK